MIYPARVTSYKIFFSENVPKLTLYGVQEQLAGFAHIDFVYKTENESPNFKAFINRGSILQVTRPLWLLSSLLVLLEQGGDIRIDENGDLTKIHIIEK